MNTALDDFLEALQIAIDRATDAVKAIDKKRDLSRCDFFDLGHEYLKVCKINNVEPWEKVWDAISYVVFLADQVKGAPPEHMPLLNRAKELVTSWYYSAA